MWSEREDRVYRADRVVRVRVILKRSIAEISVAVNDICFPQDKNRSPYTPENSLIILSKFNFAVWPW